MFMRITVTAILLLFCTSYCIADLDIADIGSPLVIDFDDFQGDGFSPTPTAGQLSSNNWRIGGTSAGDSTFGGTYTSGVFARGTSVGWASSAGIHAYDVSNANEGNWALGWNPSNATMTPGTVTLRLQNNTGEVITDLDIAYVAHGLNNGDREHSINFAWSLDDVDYTHESALDFSTGGPGDSVPNWFAEDRSIALSDLSIAPGEYVFLQWQTDEIVNANGFDEMAINDIVVTAHIPAPGALALLGVAAVLGCGRRRR